MSDTASPPSAITPIHRTEAGIWESGQRGAAACFLAERVQGDGTAAKEVPACRDERSAALAARVAAATAAALGLAPGEDMPRRFRLTGRPDARRPGRQHIAPGHRAAAILLQRRRKPGASPTAMNRPATLPARGPVGAELRAAPLASSPRPALSVVVPAYNEQEVLPAFQARIIPVMEALGLPFEVVYVNDGSRDDTLAIMLALQAADPRVAVVNLSRNFGKEIALTAGLDHAAASEAVVVIDADLQDPPEVIPDLVAAWRRGYDIAYAQRRLREGETWMKKATAAAFYRVMQRIGGRVQLPPNTGDFRLMSRRSLDALLALREQHRFMKGLFAWVGFPAVAVPYDRAPRAAGTTKWNYWKLWNFSLEGITSFTVGPLKVATYLGLATAVFAAVYGVQIILKTLLFGNPVAGYPSLMAVVLFLGGVQLMTLGIIGEYLGRIFNETKGRPLYVVERHLPSGEAYRQASSVPTGAQRFAEPGTSGASAA